MPSSRIIKSDSSEQPISAFSFRSMHRGEALTLEQPLDGSGSFMPMEIFDPSELQGHRLPVVEKKTEEPEIEIPGRFVSDDDLQQIEQDSYQRGLQDGKNLAERGLFNVFRSLRTAAEELELLREKVLRDSEDDLLTLIIAVSRKIIAQEVSQDRNVIIKVIKSALTNLSDSDELTIRLSPDDHAMLSVSNNKALQKELAGVRFILKSDPSLPHGCCQIDTALGTVDASFEAQLEEIYRRLLEERTNPTAVTEDISQVE